MLVFLALVATRLDDALAFEFKLTNDSDSVVADRLIEDRLSGPPKSNETVIFRSEDLTVDDGDFRKVVESTFGSIVGLGDDVCWQSAQVGQIRTREDYYYEELRGSSLMVLL